MIKTGINRTWGQFLATALGVFVGALLVAIWLGNERQSNLSSPFSDWVDVRGIDLPSEFEWDEEVKMLIVLDVKRDVDVLLSVLLFGVEDTAPICGTSNVMRLTIGDEFRPVNFKNYLGTCSEAIKSGKYFVQVAMYFEKEGYGQKTFVKTSNIFKITNDEVD
jgi:hypothetical protein